MDGTANGQVPGRTNDNAWPAPLLLCVYPLAGRFIREVVDLLVLAVYLEHEPARVSDSRIRRQVRTCIMHHVSCIMYHASCIQSLLQFRLSHLRFFFFFFFQNALFFWHQTSP
jgi:hypothetical protein